MNTTVNVVEQIYSGTAEALRRLNKHANRLQMILPSTLQTLHDISIFAPTPDVRARVLLLLQ